MFRGCSFCVCIAFLVTSAAVAQSLDNPGQVKASVLAKYHVTQMTADQTDVVTAGDVITLLKSGLVMYSPGHDGAMAYHDGKLNAGGMTKFMTAGPNSGNLYRVFVAGEKVWLEDVIIKPDGLYLKLISDPINDIRWTAEIKFPTDKKQPFPGPDAFMPKIAEVISAAPLPDQGAQAAAAAAPPPPAPIAPPPPPPDEPAAPPPTITLGETEANVQAAIGQPTRIVKLGTKKIEYFKDMKITFVNGKVTDVQ